MATADVDRFPGLDPELELGCGDGLPDELTVPEGRAHRAATLLLQAVVARLLGSSAEVTGNLNWYPLDGRSATAPDVLVLPAGTLEPGARSYRQRPDDPDPLVVVEVPSPTDGFVAFQRKLARLQSLGVPVYLVVLPDDAPPGEPTSVSVYRLAPGEEQASRWDGRPCPELGGLVIEAGDRLMVRLPDGLTVGSTEELLDAFDDRAHRAERRAEEATRRAEELAARLRAAGIDPG